MNPRSLYISLGLHVLLGLLMVWVSQADVIVRKPLPTATIVKLIRPASIDIPAPVRPTQEFKIPEPKVDPIPKPPPKKEQEVKPESKPPLTIPKTKPKPETVTETPERGERAQQAAPSDIPKELIGEGVSLRLKNPGFEYDFYLGIVQSKLEQNFRPPPGKQTARAIVSFTIQRDGQVTDIQIVQSSGNLLVDQAAQRAVRAAGRFPPLPAQYASGQLAMNVDFVANPGTGG